MDKTTSSQKGPEIFGPNWKIELRKILEEKINNPFLLEAQYILPYGAITKNSRMEFKNIIKDLNNEADPNIAHPFAPSIKDDAYEEDGRSRYGGFKELEDYELMCIYIRRKRGDNTVLGLRQDFHSTIKGGTFVEFKPQYKYRWDTERKRVSISYQLGTLDISLIEKEASKLLRECMEVYHMCTEEGKKSLKNMV